MLRHAESAEKSKTLRSDGIRARRTPRILRDPERRNADHSHNAHIAPPAVPSMPRRTAGGTSHPHADGSLLQSIFEIGDFVRRMRIKTRFAKLSRAPLRLLRFEVRGDFAECEWVARQPDPWDSSLPQAIGERNASLQALEDAITIRSLMLRTVPNVKSALLRAYRQSASDLLDLVIVGHVTRHDKPPVAVRSVAMRAKLSGFQFWLDDGILEPLQTEDEAVHA